MQGFYGVYYTGIAGAGAFGMLLHEGRVYAVDSQGGDVTGSYAPRDDGGIDVSLVLNWPAGAMLVTGQTLRQALSAPVNVSIAGATLAGGFQAVDLPIGRLNVRMNRKAAL